MTRTRNPDRCDFCGKNIDSGDTQYCMEVYRGRTSFSRGDLTQGKNMDMCHKCFLEVCKQGYEPKWETTIMNPNWERGAKKGTGKEYRIPKPETDVHIGQQEQITA